MSTTIYGASDDLIEVDGAIREEFNPSDGEPSYLAFSNGVVLKVTYDDEGMWRIQPRANAHLVTVDFAIGEDADRREDGSSGYSDRATMTDPVSWVVFGDRFEAAR
jgi:hypothetical protein